MAKVEEKKPIVQEIKDNLDGAKSVVLVDCADDKKRWVKNIDFPIPPIPSIIMYLDSFSSLSIEASWMVFSSLESLAPVILYFL